MKALPLPAAVGEGNVAESRYTAWLTPFLWTSIRAGIGSKPAQNQNSHLPFPLYRPFL